MIEAFLGLSPEDRRAALDVAATASGRPAYLLEKDVWVVWSLDVLFRSRFGNSLVFKGGTSLSKAYKVIHRFSEDVDLTYDIRAIAGDMVEGSAEALPGSRSQEKRWSKEIRGRLSHWVQQDALTIIRSALEAEGIPADCARAEVDKIFIRYEPLAAGREYVAPAVMLEFGARSTGEPRESIPITCDAALHVPQVTFPCARPQVMRVERTFWEKATAMHVFCAQGRFRSADRFARHWYDLSRLDAAGHAARAIADREIASAVARHKTSFFQEKSADGSVVDYHAAISGNLRLVPEGAALELLASDYSKMVEAGLLFQEVEPFEVLIERCRRIEQKANESACLSS